MILLGDFNHGPAIPGCEAEASLNYGLMVSNGMLSATVQWINQCTYCEDNTLLVNVTRANLVIDHIYLHASKASAVVEVSVSTSICSIKCILMVLQYFTSLASHIIFLKTCKLCIQFAYGEWTHVHTVSDRGLPENQT